MQKTVLFLFLETVLGYPTDISSEKLLEYENAVQT